jgi:hypothetical protein
MPTLEDELRTAMVEASEDLTVPDGLAARAWASGHRDETRRQPVGARRRTNRAGRGGPRYPRRHLVALGAGFAAIAIVVTAFALGGNSTGESAGTAASGSGNGGTTAIHGQASGGDSLTTAPQSVRGYLPRGARAPLANGSKVAAALAPGRLHSASGTSGTSGSATSSAGTSGTSGSTSGVTATRVVKDGSMELTVPKGHVQATVDGLVSLAKGLGGYVAESHTSNVAGSPTGNVTLRMPVTKFEDAVSGAQKTGHETSLTTSAHDVTGKFVDLNARLGALERTRQTYLTILGRATTIGQTLEVQQRVEDVQQQIEQIQGSLKVLRNQSADGTLTVAVSEAGSPAVVNQQHQRHGIGKAWHTSVQRFTRGTDAIIAALGTLLLVLLVIAAFAAISLLGYRVMRRAAG